MRRYWFVPIVVLVLMLLARPREAGAPRGDVLSAANARVTAVADESLVASPTDVPATPTPPAPQTATATPSLAPTKALPSPTPTQIAPTVGPSATPEPPALVPANAPPTPAPKPPAPPPRSQPVRLIIPAIGLNLRPIPVGLDPQRIPIVPKHAAGWYSGSAVPGEGSNVVFWGHVLRWKDSPNIPAPFAHLHDLQPGAEVRVITADGRERRYRVVRQMQVLPQNVQPILPTNGERLTLVSCIGDKVIVDGTLSKKFRLVTIAVPE